MEASFSSGQPFHPDRPGEIPNETAAILDMQPYRIDEAFLNPVVQREPREYQRTKHGTTSREIFTLEQGQRLEVIQGVPAKQASDIPVVMTTALGTSVYGHNWHTMLGMMGTGFPVVLIGPDGGNMHIPRNPREAGRLAKNLANISLRGIATNMHNVLEETDQSDIYEVGDIALTGESRGDMSLIAAAAIAGSFGREVIYADGIAACFPTRRKNARQHLSLLPETLAQTSLLGKLSLGMSARHAAELPRTINPNPYFLAHVVATIPTLISGSTGDLARQLDPAIRMKQTFFTGDSWCHANGWLKIFNPEDFPNVDIDLEPGNHMTIATRRVQQARQDRFRALRDELIATNGNASAVDWQHIYNAGRFALRGKPAAA